MKEDTLIGGHVSTNGGLFVSPRNAMDIGANAMQIFGSSPRMWRARIPEKEEIKKYKEELKSRGIRAVFLHAAYLVNLASSNSDIYEKSVKSLIDHLMIAEMMGTEGLIFHVGSSKGMEKEKAFNQQALGMKEVLKRVPGTSSLIMENTAGGGEKIGGTIDELANLYSRVDSSRVAVCFDTAHALESGLVSSYTKENISDLFDEIDGKIGLRNLLVFHINDSKTPPSSHHDRHENIGEGYIGIRGFQEFAKEKRIAGKPWILEVPGFEGKGPDKKNIEIVKTLLAS